MHSACRTRPAGIPQTGYYVHCNYSVFLQFWSRHYGLHCEKKYWIQIFLVFLALPAPLVPTHSAIWRAFLCVIGHMELLRSFQVLQMMSQISWRFHHAWKNESLHLSELILKCCQKAQRIRIQYQTKRTARQHTYPKQPTKGIHTTHKSKPRQSTTQNNTTPNKEKSKTTH